MFNKTKMSFFSHPPASFQALKVYFESLEKLSSLRNGDIFAEVDDTRGTKKYIKNEPECCCCNIFFFINFAFMFVSPFSLLKLHDTLKEEEEIWFWKSNQTKFVRFSLSWFLFFLALHESNNNNNEKVQWNPRRLQEIHLNFPC